MGLVETVRRYSKLPHLWGLSKRLARRLEPSGTGTDPMPALPHVHKLSQRLSEETVAALVRDYQDGASLEELQRRYSLSRGSVQRLLREAGARRRRRSLTDAEIEVLVERYEAGLTLREIAAEQGMAKTTVQDALARTRVGMRPAARRQRQYLGVSDGNNM
jgi:DNA-directed RNA polymerase specialized sigma24 family protein